MRYTPRSDRKRVVTYVTEEFTEPAEGEDLSVLIKSANVVHKDAHKWPNIKEMLLLAAIILVLLVVPYVILAIPRLPVWSAWGAAIVILLIFIFVLGSFVLCRLMGIFINERNCMDLSRLQIVCWTVLVISAYLVILFIRFLNAATITDPFNITIDWHLWALLGLSASSAVGAPVIASAKAAKDPAPLQQITADGPRIDTSRYPAPVTKAAAAFSRTEAEVAATGSGVLYGKAAPADARFTDIFQGDELNNAMYVDVHKTQMFLFTVIAIVGYGALILNMFLTTTNPASLGLPAVSDGLVAILAVSQATFLAGTGVTNTPT
ncbi:MAG: hypothetical protein WCE65_03405 [Methanoregula sp.]